MPCVSCGKLIAPRSPSPTCIRCKRGVSVGQATRLSIYERDEWTCGFCGYEVDRSLSGAHSFGPTLDHIIPRSLGGDDSAENLRLVHRYCNAARSNRPALTIEELAIQ